MKIRKLTTVAVLLALCVVGANVKLMGSIALDSFPAFLGALLFGPWIGAFLGAFGHMISSMLSGFPLTLPVHLIVAALMALCMGVFGFIRQYLGKSRWYSILLADVCGYLINVPLDLLILYPVMHQAVIALFVPLSVATIANLVLTEVVYVALPQRIKSLRFLGVTR